MSNRQLPISPELKILISTRDVIQDGPEFWCRGHYVSLRETPSGLDRITQRCAVGHLLNQMELANHPLMDRQSHTFGTQYIVNIFLAEFGLSHDQLVETNDGFAEPYGRQAVSDLLSSAIDKAKQKLTVPV